MPNNRKVFTVQNLVEKFKQAKLLVLADYQGLKMEQINSLRNAIKETGGEFEVAKNTLLGLAAKEAGVSVDSEALTGPTAAFWAYDEDLETLKALVKFAKENELPKMKVGVWNQEQIDESKLNYLATLPGKDELRAQVVGRLNSPIFGLVNSLQWNLRQLVGVLKAYQEKQAN